MAKNEQFLTCSFMLRQPSAWKREALDFAFDEYTQATVAVLANAEQCLPDVVSDGKAIRKNKDTGEITVLEKYNAISVGGVLPSSGYWKDYTLSGSLRESIVSDVNSATASYIELCKIDEETSFPTAFTHVEGERVQALEAMRGVTDIDGDATWRKVKRDLEEAEGEQRAKLMRRPRATVRPITFTRSRDFELLMDSDLSRFFVLLPILPAGHELIKQPVKGDGSLIRVRDGKPFASSSRGGIIVPLEIGERNNDWHWQFFAFILPVLDGDAAIKSAKLIRTVEGRYKLNVSFNFRCPEPYEKQTYLGIDRGILYSMAYGVVDAGDGLIVDMGYFDDGLRSLQKKAGGNIKRRQQNAKRVTLRDYKKQAQDEILHLLINRIIEIAKEHKSSIVLEDLNVRVRGAFVRSRWSRLEQFILYKCKLEGVPVHGNIFAAKTSQICIHCGEDVIEHKRDGSPVECATCGKVEHADAAAGINIARRPLYRKKEWNKRGGYRGFHRSFSKVA